MNLLQLRYCKIYLILILLLMVLLTGCGKKPDLEVLGLREKDAAGRDVLADAGEVLRVSDAGDHPSGADGDADSTDGMQEPGLTLFVCGAVVSPGVYQLPEDARICDAIEAAGGFSDTADREWLNLASPVTDGQKLRVLTCGEADALRERGMAEEDSISGEGSIPEDSQGTADGRVNLNTASREELMTLPGIGESKAEAVVRYRQEHGGFQSVEEIMRISGIKSAVFSKIKDKIKV